MLPVPPTPTTRTPAFAMCLGGSAWDTGPRFPRSSARRNATKTPNAARSCTASPPQSICTRRHARFSTRITQAATATRAGRAMTGRCLVAPYSKAIRPNHRQRIVMLRTKPPITQRSIRFLKDSVSRSADSRKNAERLNTKRREEVALPIAICPINLLTSGKLGLA